MDDSSESLQAKLAQLAEQLNNHAPSVEETLQIKASMEEILQRLEALQCTSRPLYIIVPIKNAPQGRVFWFKHTYSALTFASRMPWLTSSRSLAVRLPAACLSVTIA